MSLSSLGRNAVVAQRLSMVGPTGSRSAQEIKEEADTKLANARKGILESLAPWIPGDFVVTYGVLLTAWHDVRSSFLWMLVIAALLTLMYVVLGAFAESGFKNLTSKTKRRLVWRSIVGFLVSVFASIAIPNSGWYDIKRFSDNELPWLVTAGIAAGALAMLLKGVQKWSGIAFTDA